MAVAFKAPRPVQVYPVALPNVKEDAERRARGVSIQDWIDAPRPPATRAECDNAERELVGCPALRCKHHLGRVGEAAGFSCWLTIADMPDGEDPNKPCGERTFDLIGRVLGASGGVEQEASHALKAYNSGCHKLEQLDDEALRLLSVRKRHT